MRIALFILMELAFLSLNAQSFQEICSTEGTNGTIVNMAQYQGDILATGFFTNICGESTNYVAQWENNSWTPAAINLPGAGHYLRPIGDELYLASYSVGQDSNWLYRYNGTDLEKIGDGVYLSTATNYSNVPNIYDVIEFQGDLIICGEFDRVGEQAIAGLAKWNGSSWEGIGNLMGNIPNAPPLLFPHQLLVHNEELYVIGNFGFVDDVSVNGIAKWDGSTWSSLGGGMNSTVYSIGIYKDEIYIGGDFTEGGAAAINRLAKWSGTEWVSPGFGFMPTTVNDYTFVHTIKEIDDELWISGGLKEIHYADGSIEPCGGIISFDGATIQTFNGGIINEDIEAIIKDAAGNILVGGGVFGNGYAGILDVNSAIEPLDQRPDINIQPNPTAAILFINSETPILGYQMHDLAGRLLKNSTGNSKRLDLSGFNPGVYLLTVHLPNGSVVEKIIKE